MTKSVRVPSPYYFYVNRLLPYVDQLDLNGIRLQYQPRILEELYSSSSPTADDARLWAVLVQLFNLPDEFSSFRVSLSEEHMPLLQRIPSTEHFTLITTLELPRCRQVHDEWMKKLDLPTLCALDVSDTRITHYGVQYLAMYKRAPQLRILNLRDCKAVSSQVYSCLETFKLLSVVDLRWTGCLVSKCPTSFTSTQLNPLFYYPTHICDSVRHLQNAYPEAFSSSNVFCLRITTIKNHPSEENPPSYSSSEEDFTSSSSEDSTSYSSSSEEDSRSCCSSLEGDFTSHSSSPKQEAHPQRRRRDTRDLGPRPVEVDEMSQIAASELKIEESSRHARTFYSSRLGTQPRGSPPLSPPRMMAHELHDYKFQPKLMLFRKPTPWGSTQVPHPPKKQREKLNENAKAEINMNNPKATAFRQFLQNQSNRRSEASSSGFASSIDFDLRPTRNPPSVQPSRRLSFPTSAFAQSSNHEEQKRKQKRFSVPSSSKLRQPDGFAKPQKSIKAGTSVDGEAGRRRIENPFLKQKSIPASSTKPESKQKRPSSSRITSVPRDFDSASGSNSASSRPSAPPMKKLKPISSLPVPVLPPELLPENPKPQRIMGALPRLLKDKGSRQTEKSSGSGKMVQMDIRRCLVSKEDGK